MRWLARLAVAFTLTAIPLASATGATAATEAGNKCNADFFSVGNTIVQTSRAAGSALPIAAPVNGVVTKWRLTSTAPEAFAQTLKVLRPTASTKTFQVAGESNVAGIVTGTNSFDARLPVQAGDKFGLYGTAGALFCGGLGTADDKVGFFAGNPTVGSPMAVESEVENAQIPVSVTIEPDADNDGFGDETQDRCPQNAAVQGDCLVTPPPPPVPAVPFTIEALPQAQKGFALVLVTASTQATAAVSGVVKLGKGAQSVLNGGTATVSPGRIAQFKLKFPMAVRSRLRELSPRQSLKLSVVAKATDPLGRATSSSAALKIPGQG
jgi:hypothetical protein